MNDLTQASEESEIALVGAMILDQNCIAEVVDVCQGKDYSDRGRGHIHDVIVGLWSDGKQVEPTIVAATVDPWLVEEVWAAYNSVGTAVSAPHHARLIKDASIRRDIVAESEHIIRMARDDDRDTADVLGDAQNKMLGVSSVSEEPTLDAVLVDVVKDSEEASKRKSHVVGVPFGFRKLDRLTGGMADGDLIVVACRPSIGKTAFMNTVNKHLLLNEPDYGFAVFTAEMTSKAIMLRMISQVADVDSLKIRTGRLSADEMQRCVGASARISTAAEGRLLLDDRSGPTIGYMMSRVRQMQTTLNIKVVFIDYFQKMGVEGRYERELSMLNARARGVKDMAKKLGMPVVLLAQLSRKAEKAQEMNSPILSDLADCGAIEQEADVVVFPHRRTREARDGEVILAKQRNGEVGSAGNYSYDGPTTTWREM